MRPEREGRPDRLKKWHPVKSCLLRQGRRNPVGNTLAMAVFIAVRGCVLAA